MELGEIASREFGIVLAAVLPIIVLCLGAVGLIVESTSIWAAIAVGLGMLFVQGVRYARASNLGGLAFAAIVVANVAFGFVIVLLKVSLVH